MGFGMKVTRLRVHGSLGRSAEIHLSDEYSNAKIRFDDLPADMQKVLREWVGAKTIWREPREHTCPECNYHFRDEETS